MTLAGDSAVNEGRDAIAAGTTSLGIELGSTRIKACLIGEHPATVLATGAHEWENSYVDQTWTYPLEDVWSGLQAAVAALMTDCERRYGQRPTSVRSLGVSAMMHGYLAFDAHDELLVPFRTWRNTSTTAAATELTDMLGVNIPLRWSIAHYYQAILDAEPHVADVTFLTTLAGYVHWKLTGRRVLGVGDASGMFPIDADTIDYDTDMLAKVDERIQKRLPRVPTVTLLPEVLVAGEHAGELTLAGAALLDPTGGLQPGAVLCPPEGDAGTGMVATGAVEPRSGNVSTGTSVFAMVVLEGPLKELHTEIDMVTTPAGDPVAMVHCNNGASELATWAGVFQRFSSVAAAPVDSDSAYQALFTEALAGDADAGGILAYNHVAGEPIAGVTHGRPLVVRTPDSRLTLANLMRAQLYGVFASMILGMRVLEDEGVQIDQMLAHGGVFRTAGVAQRFLAGALGAAVAVGDTAAEGGAWGIAVLASYTASCTTAHGGDVSLGAYLRDTVFADADFSVTKPLPEDVAGFATYLEHYRAGLVVEQAAGAAL